MERKYSGDEIRQFVETMSQKDRKSWTTEEKAQLDEYSEYLNAFTHNNPVQTVSNNEPINPKPEGQAKNFKSEEQTVHQVKPKAPHAPKKELRLNTINDLNVHKLNQSDGSNSHENYKDQIKEVKTHGHNLSVKEREELPEEENPLNAHMESAPSRGSAMYTSPEFDKHLMHQEEMAGKTFVESKGNMNVFENDEYEKSNPLAKPKEKSTSWWQSIKEGFSHLKD